MQMYSYNFRAGKIVFFILCSYLSARPLFNSLFSKIWTLDVPFSLFACTHTDR